MRRMAERIFEKIITKIFTNLRRNIKLHIQETQLNQNSINIKRLMPRDM